MTEQELVIKKYEELYKLSKDGLDEELGRFKRLDDKASTNFSYHDLYSGNRRKALEFKPIKLNGAFNRSI